MPAQTAIQAPTLSDLASAPTSLGLVLLTEEGREGLFRWNPADLSAQVTADPRQAVHVAPSTDASGESGAWVRETPGGILQFDWFGTVGDGVANDYAALTAALVFMRAMPGLRTLHFTGSRTYYLGEPAVTPPVINYSNVILDGNGCTLKLAPLATGKAIFRTGNDAYVPLSFTSGLSAPDAASILTGATSGATAKVSGVGVRSGTWGTDAAGEFTLTDQAGVFQAGEQLKVGTTTVATAATSGNTFRPENIVIRGFNVDFTQTGGGRGFTLGGAGGAPEIQVGDTVVGATSGATGVVDAVYLQSGSWSAGTAAGYLGFRSQTGELTTNEDVLVGGTARARSAGVRGGGCTFVTARYPAIGLTIENCHGYQSNYGNDTPHSGGNDTWFINFACTVGNSALYSYDLNARNRSITVRGCSARHRMQLTADAGTGIDGATIVDNEVFDPFANGIAITGVGNVVRLDNVIISRNKIYRAAGRGILVAHDGYSGRSLDLAAMVPHQNRACNVLITDNIVEDYVGQGIFFGGYAQGSFGWVIDANLVHSVSTDASAGAIRCQSVDPRWMEDRHGGVAPACTIDATNVDNDTITLPNHQLATNCGIVIQPAAGSVMPGGIAADVPYFVKKIDNDTLQLYERVDATTGELSELVEISSTGSGTFTVRYGAPICEVQVGPGNVFTGSTTSGAIRFRHLRRATIGGTYRDRLDLGPVADTWLTGRFNPTSSAVLWSLGGALRSGFRGALFTVRGNAATSDSTIIVRAMFGDTKHYDLLFKDVTVKVSYVSSESENSPRFFFSEGAALTAQRQGPGYKVDGCYVEYDGTPGVSFTSFGNSANCGFWGANNSVPEGGLASKAASYTLTMLDSFGTVRFTGASSQDLTIPLAAMVPFRRGVRIKVVRAGTGAVRIVGATDGTTTVNIRTVAATTPPVVSAQKAAVELENVGPNEWLLTGSVA